MKLDTRTLLGVVVVAVVALYVYHMMAKHQGAPIL